MVETTAIKQVITESADTIVLMVSIGKRSHLSNFTYPGLAAWASLHGYSCMLVKKQMAGEDRAPHFNKLIVHRLVPGFKRYIIVDDDLMLKGGSPPIEGFDETKIGLCKDPVQSNTQAAHVKWTANTGFIIAYQKSLHLLEEAYLNGSYPYNCWDNSDQGIWGSHDQAALNNVVFKKNLVHQLDWRWNYQIVVDYYVNRGKGWHKWTQSRVYRIGFYISLLIPFSQNKRLLNQSYGLHMTMGLYPKFFRRLYK
ncbi:hypothetical protein [Mucilaginibacter glaciei]|uniref:Nucleotide-diphospho-sugar transferase domain-containing protein n=1 Tax=Mucilaginibacter glaciei TaxID=2772109 RepID=A0A926S237_9SPHI|nr:hypothetical protein [Mucilaginibacter glaciei]MBD1394720.1 hypothetical protein [Mucilaginibacter glaciei]